MDGIASKTTSWTVALRKTRNLTRWLEIIRTRKIYIAAERGWMTPLQAEESLSKMANKYGVDCWLKHAGKATIALLETRFKVKTMQYFGATQLPLILASPMPGRT